MVWLSRLVDKVVSKAMEAMMETTHDIPEDVLLPIIQVGNEQAFTPEETIYVLTRFLANQCDGARELDGIGFNRLHSQMGKSLAATPFRMWTDKQLWAARRMLSVYKNTQLAPWWEHVPEVPHPDERQVVDIHTRKPIRSVPVHRKMSLTVIGGEDFVTLQHDYDYTLVNTIKQLPRDIRRWDQDMRCWLMPLNYDVLERVAEFATEWGYELEPEVMDRVDGILVEVGEKVDLSHASEGHIDIDGFGDESIRLRPFQAAAVQYALKVVDYTQGKGMLDADEMGLGKQQLCKDNVLTPTGWRSFGSLVVGDRVIGKNGRETRVVGVYPQGEIEIVRVSFQDGTFLDTGWEHLWEVNTTSRRFRGDAPFVKSTRELVREGLYKKNGDRKWFIPLVDPVHFDPLPDPLPIDPYTLGVYLGDGAAHNSELCTDTEIIEAVGGDIIRPHDTCSYVSYGSVAGLNHALRALGLQGKTSESKFVPEPYLWATIAERHSILQGLLDTDGTPISGGGVEFCSTSPMLCDAVTHLTQSLGGIVNNRAPAQAEYTWRGEKRAGKPAERLNVKLPASFPPFRLERKAALWQPPTKYPPSRSIVSVEEVGTDKAVCIKVDAPDELYVAKDFIVTHNTPTGIAISKAVGADTTIVICPASVKWNWKREIERWIPGATAHVIQGGRTYPLVHRHLFGEERIADFFIIGYSALVFKKWRPLLTALDPDVVIMDEIHNLKNPDTKQHKEIYGFLQDCHGRVIPIGLSGTPMVNNPKDFAEIVKLVGHTDVFGWDGRSETQADKFAQQRYYGTFKNTSGTFLRQLNAKARQNFMVRRLKKDVLKELPPKVRQIVPIEIDNEAEYYDNEANIAHYFAKKRIESAKFDDQCRQEWDGTWDGEWDTELSATNYSTFEEYFHDRKKEHYGNSYWIGVQNEQLMKWELLKGVCLRGKTKGVIEWIDTFLDSTDEPLVCFVSHKQFGRDLATRYGADFIDGDMPPHKRQEAVDRFQDPNGPRVIFGNIIAAGEGITLHRASNVAMLELGWTPKAMSQAEDRCHRMGQLDSVNVYTLVAQGSQGGTTIEHEIASIIQKKQEMSDNLQDGYDATTQKQMLDLVEERIRARVGGR